PGELFEPIIDPNATVTSGDTGLTCVGCSVTDEGFVIDNNLDNAARISVPAALTGSAFIQVTDTSQTYTGAHRVGFVVQNPDTVIDLTLLETITITTLLNGTEQESFTGSSLVALSVLGGGDQALVSFDSTLDFNQVQIDLGALASLVNDLDVFSACVAPPAP
ncbi:cartilage oligomeric matrix protein, partial [Microbulbifer halophilus]